MTQDTKYTSFTYRDLFLRNEFSMISKSESVPIGGYIKVMESGKIIIVKVYKSYWKVNILSSTQEDKLGVIHLTKENHETLSERNNEVNNQSLIQLNLLAERMELDFHFN